MSRFRRGNISMSLPANGAPLLFAGFFSGTLGGCLCFAMTPPEGLYALCLGVLRAGVDVPSQLLCSLLPVLLAGAGWYLWPGRVSLLAPTALAGLLLSFSVCAFVSTFCLAGWLLSFLLLAGRGVSLLFFFWFLFRRMDLGGTRLFYDLCLACFCTGVCILVSIWLLSPALSELSQRVFIST